MQITANGHTVIEATIRENIQGALLADVQVDHDEALSGSVTISFGGDVEIVSTVLRAGVDSGRSRAQLIGGAGGLSTQLPGRAYTGVSLGTVLQHILDEAGETLSDESDDIAAQFVPRWVRPAGTAARAIAAVAARLDMAWRTQRDGTIWIGTDTFPETEIEHTEIDRQSVRAAVLIAPTSPKARPGIGLGGEQVTRVVTTVSGGGIRQQLSLSDDRLTKVLTGIVEAVVKRHLDTRALYPCTVLGQNGNGTLELMPDDALVGGGHGGLSSIPIRYGAPGETVEVAAGARVLLGFEAGDASRPIATLWEGGGEPSERTINAMSILLGEALAEVLRNGELVNITGVGAGAGVTGATITINPGTFGGKPSRVKA